MKNPWLTLDESGPPYVLPIDRDYVRRHNESARPEHRLMVNSIPEPFIGNPNTATLVLLNLNPGHSPSDECDHARLPIKTALFRNLRHEYQEFPFYPFCPTFVGTGVEEYWRPYTEALQKDADLDDATFSQRLMVIEWFPYHSARCNLKARIACTSQLYSWDLARQLLMRPGVQLLRTRSREHWKKALPKSADVPCLNTNRVPWITRGNMDWRVYDRIISLLRQRR